MAVYFRLFKKCFLYSHKIKEIVLIIQFQQYLSYLLAILKFFHQLNLKRKFVFSFVFCLMSSVLLKILWLSRSRYSINEENMMISIIVKLIFLFNYRLRIPTSFCMLFDTAIRRTCSAFLKTWIKTIQNIISCESRAFVKEERQLLLALKRRT